MDDTNKTHESDLNAKQNEVNSQKFGFGDWVLKLSIRLMIAFLVLWQFDGLWQSTQPEVSSFLQKNFPEKYREEQLKLSRFNENNAYISGIERDLSKKLAIAQQAILEKGVAEKEVQIRQLEIDALCRYYDTSILMFSHLADKYSERELNKVVSCTNQECFDIINRTDKAKQLCQNT